MGLLITPSGMRLPFSVSCYTEAYCKAKKIAYRKQTELAAQLIRQLPLPPEVRVVVLGDTAFDAKAIRTACEERKFSWIVPINPERVLAGEKPRPKVSSLSEDLTADQMVCLEPKKKPFLVLRFILARGSTSTIDGSPATGSGRNSSPARITCTRKVETFIP